MADGEEEKAKLIDPKKRYAGWTIEQKLDEGGFGQVFRVSKMIKGEKKTAALKAESNDVEGGSAIKLEMAVLMMLNKDGKDIVPHVPYLFHAAKRRKFCYMVVTLLGSNLRSIKNWKNQKSDTPPPTLSPGTWARLALQALYSIKVVHDVGFVHRDIKPANFMMGRDDDPPRARLVHILDFGLARSFAFQRDNKQWVPRRARASAEFRGTMRYCSPNVHCKMEQGRNDDLVSFMYVVLELHRGLPWQKTQSKSDLEKEKTSLTPELNKYFPKEIHPIMKHILSLDCYQRPNYAMMAECFSALCKTHKVTFATPYDWEIDDKKTLGADILKKRGKAPEYENVEFFKQDPVGVNDAPPKDGTGTSDIAAQNTAEDNRSMGNKNMKTTNKTTVDTQEP